MKIYLASTAGEIEWKKNFRENLEEGIEFLDPDPQSENININVVSKDRLMLSKATHLVAYIQQPTFGTTMEIVYARVECCIPVFIINPSMRYFQDPWLNYHCEIMYTDVFKCIKFLNEINHA